MSRIESAIALSRRSAKWRGEKKINLSDYAYVDVRHVLAAKILTMQIHSTTHLFYISLNRM